ncbi:hypothetical protein TRFO_35933 [Tritrichomonas foetus]|uniref:Uncharacterized protein n=1 Tax=Tritrichomonas foetus TaxID=1144522 RepID=A0A1J4JGG9_9EUKA|nr:hypothetical protein TRFO_35933 [Tritrichomonas foetus]|eukprot:OHS97761.1 hypothetical protein TRFO_35933 [Tritrichomonas foetus]
MYHDSQNHNKNGVKNKAHENKTLEPNTNATMSKVITQRKSGHQKVASQQKKIDDKISMKTSTKEEIQPKRVGKNSAKKEERENAHESLKKILEQQKNLQKQFLKQIKTERKRMEQMMVHVIPGKVDSETKKALKLAENKLSEMISYLKELSSAYRSNIPVKDQSESIAPVSSNN